MVKPPKPRNEYSKANWGDHVESREGRSFHFNSTSNLTAIVSKLKDKQWDKILMAAQESVKRKKKVTVDVSLPEVSRAVVELRDDDSDLTSDVAVEDGGV